MLSASSRIGETTYTMSGANVGKAVGDALHEDCSKGTLREKLLPSPGSLTMRRVPFIKCVRRRQMGRPRPVPATTLVLPLVW